MTSVQPDVTIIPARARPTRKLLIPLTSALFVFFYGVFETDGLLPTTAALLVWIVCWAAVILVLGVPLFWARMELTEDGTLTRRLFRTSRVDATDLRAIHSRGEHPWAINPPGVITFQDGRGGRVNVELTLGAWRPEHPLFPSLGAIIERSGLPLGGIVTAQLEQAMNRRLDVGAANRRAFDEARDDLRRGQVPPHRTRGTWNRTLLSLLFFGAFPLFLIRSAQTGMVPADQVRLWQAGFAAIALVAILASVLLPARSLEMDDRARLTIRAVGRRSGLDLTRLTEVALEPDAPYLERTVGGRARSGQRVPKLQLHDEDGRTLTIRLGDQWKRQVPILRYVLAAAEERGVPLSQHARYELEFRVGLIQGPEWIGGSSDRRTP